MTLKPCPFCGGEPVDDMPSFVGLRWVTCSDCQAAGPVADRNLATAAELWNERPTERELCDALEALMAQMQAALDKAKGS